MGTSNQKGELGEHAFAEALQRIGFVNATERNEQGFADLPPSCPGQFQQTPRDRYRDSAGRVLTDFFLDIKEREVHIDVKCHNGWHWYAPLQTWQAGVGIELLLDYDARARLDMTTAHVIIIKRGIVPLGRIDGLPLPHHPSPVGAWIASVAELLASGFRHDIPGEKGISCCSTRAIDGGVWRPFAPWNESKRRLIAKREDDPAAWDSFFVREMPLQIVLP